MGRSDEDLNRRDNRREKAKAARSRRASAAGSYDITALEWLPLVALVEALTAHGGALRIGLTRDGGALALGVYLGDDYATEYVRPAENLTVALEEIAIAWLPNNGEEFVVAHQRLLQGAQKR